MEDNKHSTKAVIGISAISSIVTLILTIVIMLTINSIQIADLQRQNELDKNKDIGVFQSIYEMYQSLPESQRNYEMYLKLAEIDMYYRQHYVKADELDNENLLYYVANGYIAGAGDMHGEFYTANDFQSIMNSTQGETVGVGIYVNMDTETRCIKILTVMKDSPAQKAGLKAGDIIVEIDGQSVTEVGYYTALNLVAGKEGTKVEITVLRGNEKIKVTATREKFVTETVYYHKYELDNSIGVIRILEFNETMPKQFKNALNTLISEGCTSVVFDMRGNTGGTLDSVVEVLDYLLPEGDIVYVTDKNGTVIEKYESGASCIEMPMAVLTDEYTASAAELFSCALRDYEKAKLVGTKSYGKGSMQTIFMMDDGTGLRFTTYLYSPPKSANYDGVGLTPDIEVIPTEEMTQKNYFEITDQEDNQLKAACDYLKGKK